MRCRRYRSFILLLLLASGPPSSSVRYTAFHYCCALPGLRFAAASSHLAGPPPPICERLTKRGVTYHPKRRGDIVLRYRNLNLRIRYLQIGSHTKEISEGCRFHFSHQVAAVYLYGDLARADLCSDFF